MTIYESDMNAGPSEHRTASVATRSVKRGESNLFRILVAANLVFIEMRCSLKGSNLGEVTLRIT